MKLWPLTIDVALRFNSRVAVWWFPGWHFWRRRSVYGLVVGVLGLWLHATIDFEDRPR